MVGIKKQCIFIPPEPLLRQPLIAKLDIQEYSVKTAAEYGLTPPMPELRRRSIHSEKPCRTLVEPE